MNILAPAIAGYLSHWTDRLPVRMKETRNSKIYYSSLIREGTWKEGNREGIISL